MLSLRQLCKRMLPCVPGDEMFKDAAGHLLPWFRLKKQRKILVGTTLEQQRRIQGAWAVTRGGSDRGDSNPRGLLYN